MKIYSGLIAIFCFLNNSAAENQDGLQCFVPGKCIQSHLVGSSVAADEFICLAACQAIGQSCTWFTFFPELGFCQSFSDCIQLDTASCPDCISGESACTAHPDPKCWVTGECRGNLLDISASSSKNQCLQTCKDNSKCNWFTYIPSVNACELFENCPTLDPGCEACLSGERTCDEVVEDKGSVALIVGGEGKFDVELYSPEGLCQHLLAQVPGSMTEFWRPVLAYLDGKIMACHGSENNTDCWQYEASSNSWLFQTRSLSTHNHMPGAIFGGKLYIVGEEAEYFDPSISSWLSWKKPTIVTGADPCFLTWKSNFVLIGGKTNPRLVQIYNTFTNEWTTKNSSNVPMDVHNSACVVLPNEDILVVGSETFEDFRSAAIYNVAKNTWTALQKTSVLREGTDLVVLGHRIFAIGGLNDSVEEFHLENNTWTSVSQTLTIPRIQHNSVSLPASIFSEISGGCQGVL